MMSEAEREVREEAEADNSETEQDATPDDGERGVKRSAPDSTEPAENDIDVTSANDWEHAELGDKGRKNKFLRLMGASKKEHHGKFVIGDKERASDRSADKTDKLSENLASQYEQSMAHRLQGGRRGHIGFGFQREEIPQEEAGDGDKTQEEAGDGDKTVSSATETNTETSEEQKSTEEDSKEPLPDSSTEASTESKYQNLGFVKSAR